MGTVGCYDAVVLSESVHQSQRHVRWNCCKGLTIQSEPEQQVSMECTFPTDMMPGDYI